MELKEKFLQICDEKIRREGKDELLTWLSKSDFFVAPASTKYHGNYQGGRVEHSVNVYERLCELASKYSFLGVSEETLAIVGLFHDVCKANFYTKGFRNVKNEDTGKWEKVEIYQVDERFPMGHGEKSCIILQYYMKLSPKELMAIRWHMGGFDSATKGGDYGMSNAYSMEPLCVMTHLSDMEATYLTERKLEKDTTSGND